MDPTLIDLLTAGNDDDLRSKAQMFAQQLRGDKQLGMMGQIGGKRAAGLGREMLSDADMGEKGMLAAGISNQNNNFKQQKLIGDFDKALAVQQARNEGAMGLAQLRALAAGSKERPTKPLPGKEMDTLKDLEETIRAALDIQKSFDPKYAGQPILGAVKNLAGRTLGGIAGQEAVAQNDFWARFKMLVELPKRHDFFGSALTPTEKASWQEAQNIGPTAPPELVKRKFDEMVTLAQKGLDHRVRARKSEGVYSGEAIDAIAPHATQGGGSAAPAAGVRSFKRVNGKLVEVK